MRLKIVKNTLLLTLFLSANYIIAQDCKVLHKSLNETYQGDCKKGKAHGKGIAKGIDTYEGEFKKGRPNGNGTYTWANGDVYIGEFKKGLKEGKGKLTYKNDNKVEEGYWSKDDYIGISKTPYKLLTKSENIVLVNFSRRHKESGNSIRLYFKKNDRLVTKPEVDRVVPVKGNFANIVRMPDFVELTHVQYPVKFTVQYEREIYEFEIFQPGVWKIQTELRSIDGLDAPTKF